MTADFLTGPSIVVPAWRIFTTLETEQLTLPQQGTWTRTRNAL